MAEILLKCPKCGTEYQLPASAIPPEGREVECTECNNSWLALAPAGATETPPTEPMLSEYDDESQPSAVVHHAPSHSRAPASTPTPAPNDESTPLPTQTPPLRRQLPENVLKILREEVEFEHRARQGQLHRDRNETPATPHSDDELWPATTITEPSAAAEIAPAMSPLSARSDRTERVEMETVVTKNLTVPKVKPRSGYWWGFGIAAIAAAVALAMYIAPTNVIGTGSVGDTVTRYQQHVDAGRHWLQERVSALSRE